MSILIKKAKIIQPEGPYHLEIKDILIEKGIISKISNSISTKAKKTISGNQLHVCLGLLDIGAHSGEPGYEHRETLESLRASACKGGYTAVAIFPNTEPVIDNSTALQWFKNEERQLVKILPIGSISVGNRGKDLAELLDMKNSGACAFSDGLKSINDNGLLLRALQYIKSANGLIIHHPNDLQICSDGEMHEGPVSTSLGLQGTPTMAELSHVERDLSLLDYTESKLLLHLVSSEESLQSIKKYKGKGKLYCSVAYLNLLRTDEDLRYFDSNYKLSPPLRSKADQKALIKAINDQTIDVICSNHVPLEEELKKDAFPNTEPGAIGLQTCFPALADQMPTEKALSNLIQLMAINPRSILDIDVPEIKKSEIPELMIFDTDSEWAFNENNNCSLSSNNPFLNYKFKTEIKGVIKGKKAAFF